MDICMTDAMIGVRGYMDGWMDTERKDRLGATNAKKITGQRMMVDG